MIYYVTNRKTSIPRDIFNDITVIGEEDGRELFIQLLGNKRVLALDIETNGLDAYKNNILLLGIGTASIQFAMDASVDISFYTNYIKKKKTIITLGHNIKFDIKLLKVETNVLLDKVYDTMIADQRIYQKMGYGWGLEELIRRHLNKQIIKSTRMEFVGKDVNTFKIEPHHLYYLRGDLVDLFAIRKKQQALIKKWKMEFLIYGIEFPLISTIAKAELRGFTLNKERWIKRVQRDKARKHQIHLELDAELRRLVEVKKDISIQGLSPRQILGTKLNRDRVLIEEEFFLDNGTVNQKDLFGEQMKTSAYTGLKKKVKTGDAYFDYSTKKDVVLIFAALQEPMITSYEDIIVPQLDSKGKITLSLDVFSLNSDILERYLILKPNSIMKPFIMLIKELAKNKVALSTFGENFLEKINPITGKIHTIFRQCFAETGRFQSGGGKREPNLPNFQNIPRDKEYRECFTTDTDKYEILTADYSGAELIVMASHAQDFRLLELSKGDMHSHMATRSWRNIYKHRYTGIRNLIHKNPTITSVTLQEELQDYLKKSAEFTVTKDTGDLRQEFKGMTFGAVYGMYPKKAGKTLNISPDEGRIVITTIKNEIPDTFRMVEQATQFASEYGFVILNNRTNSRAWFVNLIRQIKGEISKDTHFLDISKDESEARNIRIQGTQADFVKEASVLIDKYFKKFNIDARILSWIHDEFVIEIPLGKGIYVDPFDASITHENLYIPLTDIMVKVANRYLRNVTIKVDYVILPHWTK